ncbi:MAG TPA: erythromycin esterase family protein [Longimicrobium sp.]|nr:erythromycin esterase family protein [Longimicrobium sp.]
MRLRQVIAAGALAFLSACAGACGAGGAAAESTGGEPAPAAGSAGSDSTAALVAMIRQAAVPITGGERDYDPLMAMIGDARFVLLGEATHGTHEFYAERARITRRLIEEKGFTGIALEGDWPLAERVHHFARGRGSDPAAAQALAGFRTRFPQWMWSNAEIAELVNWLRAYNERAPATARVGFYGLDVYTLYESAEAVEAYLAGVDAEAARAARGRYACFDRHGGNVHAYGRASAADSAAGCRAQAEQQRQEMERRYAALPAGAPDSATGALFSALRNARVVENAEEYYRTLYAGGASTWNLRDRHMAETLEQISAHLARQGRPAKVVVWAHNTHAGDARASRMADAGELNLGQLVRERFAGETFLLGFTTYTGTVLAATAWGQPGRVRALRPALPESYPGLFHRAGVPAFILPLTGTGALAQALATPRPERIVGVVYLPDTERQSHYFTSMLSRQFDAVVHVDTTRALTPLR